MKRMLTFSFLALATLTALAMPGVVRVDPWARCRHRLEQDDDQCARDREDAAPPAMRAGAIVQSSVFDALNGIERRYTPIHVQPAAPPGASRQAAVVGAAYEALVGLFPLNNRRSTRSSRRRSRRSVAEGTTSPSSGASPGVSRWPTTSSPGVLATASARCSSGRPGQRRRRLPAHAARVRRTACSVSSRT